MPPIDETLLVSADVDNYNGLDECYDGIDNDCDGLIDAEDSSCLNNLGEPDGWISSENLDGMNEERNRTSFQPHYGSICITMNLANNA